MDRNQFAQRFAAAATQARSFAQSLVLESLPESLRFRVLLNSSYDGNPLHPDERVFPEDGSIEQSLALLRCSEAEVVELLWRDGMVPEWINLSVCARLPDATVLEALCCGRYTANAELLYHAHEGYPPFHVVGPPLPFDYEFEEDRGSKYSVFDRAECCSLTELAALEAYADKPWLLTLYGPAFTDDVLASVPRMPRLERLETVGSPLRGPGLTRLAAQPKLRLLRLRLHGVERFSLPDLTEFATLRDLEIHNLPGDAWASPRFERDAHQLARLWLRTDDALTIPSAWPHALTELRIDAVRVHGGSLPARIDSLTLMVPGQAPDEIERLLASLRAVKHLDLRSTPVTDTMLEHALERIRPDSLCVVDTAVSSSYLRELAVRRPQLRLSPSPR